MSEELYESYDFDSDLNIPTFNPTTITDEDGNIIVGPGDIFNPGDLPNPGDELPSIIGNMSSTSNENSIFKLGETYNVVVTNLRNNNLSDSANDIFVWPYLLELDHARSVDISDSKIKIYQRNNDKDEWTLKTIWKDSFNSLGNRLYSNNKICAGSAFEILSTGNDEYLFRKAEHEITFKDGRVITTEIMKPAAVTSTSFLPDGYSTPYIDGTKCSPVMNTGANFSPAIIFNKIAGKLKICANDGYSGGRVRVATSIGVVCSDNGGVYLTDQFYSDPISFTDGIGEYAYTIDTAKIRALAQELEAKNKTAEMGMVVFTLVYDDYDADRGYSYKIYGCVDSSDDTTRFGSMVIGFNPTGEELRDSTLLRRISNDDQRLLDIILGNSNKK